MRTRYRVALTIVVIAAASGRVHAQERTEQEIVEAVVRAGPRAQAIRAATEVVALEQAARRVFPNPAATYSREGAGFTEFFQVDQSLPAFGLRQALERAGVAAGEAAEAERDGRLWQLRSDAHDAVARLRASHERLQAARSLVGLVEGLIGVLTTREREGEGSRFDRLRAQQELVDAQQIVVTASVEHSNARSELAALLPRGAVVPETVSPRPHAPLADSVDTLVTRATTGRAELRVLQATARQLSLEAVVARRATGLAPTFTAGLKRADDAGEARAGAVVGVGMAVPLFNRGRRAAARWEAERTRTEFERASVEADIRAQIARAADALAIRRQHAPGVGAAVTSAGELIGIADVAYREGEIGILQLVDAYRTAARARERAVDTNLNLSLAEIALERAVGVSLWP